MDHIHELLTRGVDTIYPSYEALEKILRSGKKLKLYQGFDPTGTQLHLGHMVGFRKLAQWQRLGHRVIFLIGDGTGQAGDPSGKLTARDKFLTRDQLRTNAKDYVKQASKIVNFEGENPVEILFNADWLNELKLVDILDIAGRFSLQQLAERDLFQERIKKGESVNLREFLYPLLQGYDSVAMKVDLELGGSDQTFNMLVGRTLVQEMLHKEKFVMTTPLLTDAKGRKIGKTEGNVIALTDNPNDLYGKVMALPDEVVIKGLEYLTDVAMTEINAFEYAMKKGENPIKFKKILAFEIVKQLHDEKNAENAENHFGKTIQQKELSTAIPKVSLPLTKVSGLSVADVLFETNMAASISEAKRLIQQGGVKINGEVLASPSDPFDQFMNEDKIIIQVGKLKSLEITIEK